MKRHRVLNLRCGTIYFPHYRPKISRYMTLRKLAAWIVGIIVLLGLGVALSWGGNALGVPSGIDLTGPVIVTHGSGRLSYDEEVDSVQTFYGLLTGALSFVVALWAARATYARSWRADFSGKGWVTLLAWAMALTVLLILSLVSDIVFRRFHGDVASYVRTALELCASVGVALASYRWWSRQTRRLEESADNGR